MRDWGAGRVPKPHPGRALAVLIAGIVLVAGLFALAAPALGVLVAVALLAVLALWVATRGRAIIRDAGARPLAPHDAPRFANIAAGLSTDLGIEQPGLWIADEGGPNAFVAWSAGPQIGLTRAVLSDLTRTEVEAIVAHCLVRVVTGEAKATTFALGLGPLPTGGVRVGGPLDVASAALTRYPPALASALARSAPRGGRFGPAWFSSEGPSHVPPAERIAALEDL
jgi:Zn-dependent protease with chaperone function